MGEVIDSSSNCLATVSAWAVSPRAALSRAEWKRMSALFSLPIAAALSSASPSSIAPTRTKNSDSQIVENSGPCDLADRYVSTARDVSPLRRYAKARNR